MKEKFAVGVINVLVLQPIPKIPQKSIEGKGLHKYSLKSGIITSYKVAIRAARKAIKKAGGSKKILVLPIELDFTSHKIFIK